MSLFSRKSPPPMIQTVVKASSSFITPADNFRRVLGAADHSTNGSEDVATSGPYRAAAGSKNAGTGAASFFPAARITSAF